MALVLADRVNETTTTAGTGTLTLAGAVSGYQSFSVIGDANITYYTIVHQTANEWEVGIGTYTSAGTTLSRDTVLASSAGGTTKVTFSAGTKFVFCDYPAGKAIYQDASGSTYVPGLLAGGSSSANYVQITGAATTVAPKITAQGSDTNIDLAFSTKGTGWYSFFGNNSGIQTFQMQNVSSAVNWIRSFNSVSTFKVGLSAQGSDTDVGFIIQSKGTGAINFQTAGGTTQLAVTDTASAVNYVQVTGAATTATPAISVQGSDANIQLNLNSKGIGAVSLNTSSGAPVFIAQPQTSNVNYGRFTSTSTGISPLFAVIGSDTNIDLRLRTQGTGSYVFESNASGTTQFRISGANAAVNYLQVAGSVSSFVPALSSQGTDTNISMVFQPKGTGAIDLAAGSSGVNISNGGTVTAITRTNGGSNYTSPPAIAISAPTTAGGVQATASATIWVESPTIVSGGTGYSVNDVLTVSGGTFTTAAQLTVTSVSGGVITGVSTSGAARGNYTAVPTNPASVTGGTGTGATFNLIFGVSQLTLTITNAGSGYVEQPTVTFSGGGGAGAAAYATVGGNVSIKSIGNQLNFYAANSGIGLQVYDAGGGSGSSGAYWKFGQNFSSVQAALISTATGYISSTGTNPLSFLTNATLQEQFRVAHTASAVNYVQVTGSATTNQPLISAQGSDTNISLSITSKGAGSINFWTNTSGTRQFSVADTASAVNYVQVTGAATGNRPVISAQGSDSSISIDLNAKGATSIIRLQASGSNIMRLNGVASSVNWLDVFSSATGSAPFILSSGSDTNIDLTLTPKGTGKVVVTNGIQGGSF